MPSRMLPEPTPQTRHFWDRCKDGELRLQRCTACKSSYFPPRPFCPKCSSRAVEVYKASGKGTLYSYVINMRPRPDMGTEPYAIAVVQLDEGPRMMTNIVGCAPDDVRIGMAVEVTFEDLGDGASVPLFRPAT